MVLETRVEALTRALTGELSADVEPLRIELKWDASLGQVRAKTRQMVPKKMDWLKREMQYLQAAGMARLKRLATCATGPMAVPKGRSFRIVADYRVANAQVE